MAVASSTKTASGVVKGSPGMLAGVVLAAGSDTATVIIYDNASAGSGTVLVKLTAVANTSASVIFSAPVVASKGIYAALTGTAESVSVLFV